MRVQILRFLTLATVGILTGLVLAVVGLPYGRADYRALAELYHGPTDTTGTFHAAVDCNTATASTDSSCYYLVGFGTLAVDVTLGNSTGSSALIAAYNWTLVDPDTARLNAQTPASCVAPRLNCNPNFLDNVESPQGLSGSPWSCEPVLPDIDNNNANGDESLLACLNPTSSSAIAAGPDHVDLGRVTYDILTYFPAGGVTLTLKDVNVFDEALVELMSCNPVNFTAGPCFSATLLSDPFDYDGDGISDYYDNCPFNHNPGQQNADRNFISAQGLHIDDFSRANSDTTGDECDPDADNDGRSNSDEFAGAGGCPATDWLRLDTDGDRVIDGAECALGSDPTSAASKPPAIVAPDADSDGLPDALDPNDADTDSDDDGLRDGLEFRGYGTNPAMAHTDFDSGSDMCEAVSITNEFEPRINSGDQLLLAQEYIRPVPPARLANYDIDKDGSINSGDQLMMAQRFGKCP